MISVKWLNYFLKKGTGKIHSFFFPYNFSTDTCHFVFLAA
jgi:hypothetical protein